LLAAHGERRSGADNASVTALAAAIAARGAATEIRCGFINAVPTVVEALRSFTVPDILVYPLFMSNGYFARVELPRLVTTAGRPLQGVAMLPPLGLTAGLANLIADRAADTVRSRGWVDGRVSVALLAHGSIKDVASRQAAESTAQRIDVLQRFAGVSCAFLDEPPALADCIAYLTEPVVVVGLFVGSGLHGSQDVPALVGRLGPNVAFGGNVGDWPEIAEVVVGALNRPRASRLATDEMCHREPREFSAH
jgi:sirohydrochlorin ferrochelatase